MYDIQPLFGPSNADATALGLSSVGEVAGYSYNLRFDDPGGPFGAVWTRGALSSSLPPNQASELSGINVAGDCAGYRYVNDVQHAIMVKGGAVVDLAALVGAGSVAADINDSGRVCGMGQNPQTFILDSATNQLVGSITPLPGSARTYAGAINNAGEILGKCDDRGIVSDGALTKDLGPVNFVADINDSGVACGTIQKRDPDLPAPAICDTKQAAPAFVEIRTPSGSVGGGAFGINNKGYVVGFCASSEDPDAVTNAFLYDGNSSVDLNQLISDPGWHLKFATAINDKGQIAGWGSLYGEHTAYLLTPQGPHRILTLPELVATLLGGVAVDGGGWVIVGRHGGPVGPWGPWNTLPEPKRDVLVALAMDEIARFIVDRRAREAIRSALIKVTEKRVGSLGEVDAEIRSALRKPRVQEPRRESLRSVMSRLALKGLRPR